ncbi:MAG: alpha-N-arabinofuranosidase [Bacteroidales bacterium]|nr:alpha-N-arabinofuranosidase [Bacteroidales bacterium]
MKRKTYAPVLLISICLLSHDSNLQGQTIAISDRPGVAVLLIDTDRQPAKTEVSVYGHFLEHINHSVVDGLFAEQVQGCGFEGNDFETYWVPEGEKGKVEVAEVKFQNGEKSIRLSPGGGTAGIKQGRIFIESGKEYSGSVWIKPVSGTVRLSFLVTDAGGKQLTTIPLRYSGKEWQEVTFAFKSGITDKHAVIGLVATGTGELIVDFISMMRSDIRNAGSLRPDLLEAMKALKPPFIRWPGGSFASIYKWKDGIGPRVARKYHPNTTWGGYSDYYGFGTDEFMELCRQLKSEPLIVLSATNTDEQQFRDAMDWIHYLNDPPTTQWGRVRAENGHAQPYNVRYFQIDNEPMNHGLTPEQYAEIVNLYGRGIRKIAPEVKIIACGQKRSNDLNWSQKLIDLAGDNFDILGCHNYEYENDNFQTGLQRIEEYLIRLRDYIKISKHPDIKIAVLEWGLCRTYDWRAGLHTAGTLMMYEKLGPELTMSCPALWMRNTTDDPTWTAFIYHDHVSWFPGSGYVVEKLFRDYYEENLLASAKGTFKDINNRQQFFNGISSMRPEEWKSGTFEAVATASTDGRRIVIKAVNYEGKKNTLLVRVQGSGAPESADVKVITLKAGLTDAPSMENPDLIRPVTSTAEFNRNLMAFETDPYSVVVIEITEKK